MKNVRVDGLDLIYDCDASDCETPGVPHRIPMVRIMASLEATYRELAYLLDPRMEDLAVLLQYVWQTAYPGSTPGDRVPTADTDWDSELSQLLEELSAHYTDPSLRKSRTRQLPASAKLLN